MLNPPARDTAIRDYYCSFSSKAGYYWPPQDLIVLSGILSEQYDVAAIDAIGQKMSIHQCYAQLAAQDFDAVIFSTGSATLADDIRFIERLKRKKPCRVIASSAIFKFIGEEILHTFDALDGALVDFFHDGIVHYLNGDFLNIRGMVYRDSSGIVTAPAYGNDTFAFGLPRHEWFLNRACGIPFLKNPFAVVITSVGCPFKCKFCIAGQIVYRRRDFDNALEEIRHIKKAGISNIFFADPTFTADKEFCVRLCREIEELRLRWICNSHPSLLIDDNFVAQLKKGGCRTVMVGVESGNEDMLTRYSKTTSLGQIKTAFKICRKNEIQTLAYFIIGFPGETKESITNTIRFSKELDCDFVSFDFPTPDFGTALREELIRNNHISSDVLFGWDPSKQPAYTLDGLSMHDLIKLRNRAYTEFYLRPAYLKNRLLHSNTELNGLVRGGLSLLLRR